MPADTEFDKPSGAPSAMQNSPGRRPAELPSGTVGSGADERTRTIATSLSRSACSTTPG